VPLLFPGLIVWQPLVWQRCQAKAGIRDSDALCVVGQYLGRNVHKWTRPDVHHLSRPFAAMRENQSMNVGSVATNRQPYLS